MHSLRVHHSRDRDLRAGVKIHQIPNYCRGAEVEGNTITSLTGVTALDCNQFVIISNGGNIVIRLPDCRRHRPNEAHIWNQFDILSPNAIGKPFELGSLVFQTWRLEPAVNFADTRGNAAVPQDAVAEYFLDLRKARFRNSDCHLPGHLSPAGQTDAGLITPLLRSLISDESGSPASPETTTLHFPQLPIPPHGISIALPASEAALESSVPAGTSTFVPPGFECYTYQLATSHIFRHIK